MLYVVFIVCVFKFMYYVEVVFMMQQLKSMVVIVHPNLDKLNIVEKVVMGGAIIKGRFFPHNTILTPH